MKMYCGKSVQSCPICNSHFVSATALKEHLQSSVKKMPVSCNKEVYTDAIANFAFV